MNSTFKKWLSVALILAALFTFTACELDTDYTAQSSESSSYFSQMTSDIAESVEDGQSSLSSKGQSAQAPVGEGTASAVKLADIPAYSGKAYVAINNNVPNFSAAELTTTAYEKYSNLDSLGRCGIALASCGTEIMPAADEERGSISSVKPSGWVQAKYSGISGGYLWNRCHLIGWQLSAENANKKNLITGTRYMNIDGMLTFENMVADYIKETENHVAYRITPIFEGNNLVCSGVQMEGYSIEDEGEGICFNVYCYNVQPGITINYATGESTGPQTVSSATPSSKAESVYVAPSEDENVIAVMVWIPRTGSKYHRNPSCSNMKNPSEVSQSEAINRGYEPCSKCY